MGGQGVISGFTGDRPGCPGVDPTTATNMEVVGLVQLNASNPVGGNYQARLVARAQTDARNGDVVRIVHTTSGTATWALARVANAGGTNSSTLAQGTLLSSGAAGSRWWICLRTSGTTIQVRFWRDGTAEPAGWAPRRRRLQLLDERTRPRSAPLPRAASRLRFHLVLFDDFLATAG